MTTFADREHAIEAHYALLELTAFRDRLHRYKDLGLRLAVRLGLRGIEAERLALELALRFAAEPIDERLCSSLAAELPWPDFTSSDIGHVATADDMLEHVDSALTPPRSWVEFVIAQLLMLFGMSPAELKAGAKDIPVKN